MKQWRALSTKKLDAKTRMMLQQHGVDVTEKDLISITPVTAAIARQIQSAKDRTVIFTSSNAVYAVSDLLVATPMQVFCMAGKTKRAVEEKLKQVTIIATADNARAIAAQIAGKGISEAIFFCGDIRRDELPELLKEKQVKLDEIIVYRTTETPVKVEEQYEAVLFFSPSAVRSFFRLNELKQNVVCFSIGNTTAAELKKYTANDIVVAATPSEESVAKSVIEAYTS